MNGRHRATDCFCSDAWRLASTRGASIEVWLVLAFSPDGFAEHVAELSHVVGCLTAFHPLRMVPAHGQFLEFVAILRSLVPRRPEHSLHPPGQVTASHGCPQTLRWVAGCRRDAGRPPCERTEHVRKSFVWACVFRLNPVMPLAPRESCQLNHLLARLLSGAPD